MTAVPVLHPAAPRLVLASASPRRRHPLAPIGLPPPAGDPPRHDLTGPVEAFAPPHDGSLGQFVRSDSVPHGLSAAGAGVWGLAGGPPAAIRPPPKSCTRARRIGGARPPSPTASCSSWRSSR